MKFLSICSGIDAASVAFNPLGWEAVGFSEIEPFPCAVLAHRYPSVPNFGDMTKFAEWPEDVLVQADAVVGGPPCQAFSVAGKREGLNDARGNLTLTYVDLINHVDSARTLRGLPPAVVLYENVPGLLSDATNAFGCFLAGLAGESGELQPAGGKWSNAGCVFGPARTVAWRVLDAQYFGVAQRRRRVFVVASARKGFDPVAVLFEPDGVRRDSPPSRETGQAIAPCVTAGAGNGGAAHGARSGSAKDNLIVPVGGRPDVDQPGPTAFGGNRTSGSIRITPALLAHHGSGWKGDFESETFLVQPVAVDTSYQRPLPGEDSDAYWQRMAAHESQHGITPDMLADGAEPWPQPLPFDTTQLTSVVNRSNPQPGDPCHPLAAGAHAPAIAFQDRHRGDDGRGYDRAPPMSVEQIGTLETVKPWNVVTPVAFPANLSGTQCASSEDLSPALGAANPTAVAFQPGNSSRGAGASPSTEVFPTLKSDHGRGASDQQPHVAYTTKLHNTASNQSGKFYEEYATSLDRTSPPPAVLQPPVSVGAFKGGQGSAAGGIGWDEHVSPTLSSADSGSNRTPTLLTAMQVRRLTPVECERLQGFPDGYTDIPWGKKLAGHCPDGPRYKSLGNSWAVPVVRWIGQRISHACAHNPITPNA